jgi:hypothetical protein
LSAWCRTRARASGGSGSFWRRADDQRRGAATLEHPQRELDSRIELLAVEPDLRLARQRQLNTGRRA